MKAFNIDTAQGEELDNFGALLGAYRLQGESDIEFRRKIYSVSAAGVVYKTETPPQIMASQATLRDYFAAKAMQAIIPDAERLVAARMAKGASGIQAVAEAAYYMADAMLAARVK